MSEPHEAPDAPPGAEQARHDEDASSTAEAHGRERRSKFRFKSSKHRSSRHHSHDDAHDSSSRHRSSHHRHKRRKHSSSPPKPVTDDANPSAIPNPTYDTLDPDAAFRESLFDAMADDEGAAYWEAVYGQPIHVFSPPGGTLGSSPDGLEAMTDEEYASYVRQKMWEKTHAGLLEEREKTARRREEDDLRRKESAAATKKMEESLRFGEERRERKMWLRSWEEYLARWKSWDGDIGRIPWPREEGLKVGQRYKVDEGDIRTFLVRGLELKELGEKQFAARLKDERLRWHPDKVQQKLGGKVDQSVMKDVTAVFQIIDKLWNESRGKA